MKPSTSQDILTYFQGTLDVFKAIEDIVATRNKTLKFKAIKNILDLLKARVEAAQKYVKAGGKTEFDVIFQQSLYNPIIEWFTEEVSK